MANNATNSGAGIMLDALPSPMGVKLHKGDPTDAGTAQLSVQYPALVSVTFGPTAAGVRLSTAVAAWVAGAGAETITHVSVWNAAGTLCLFQGPLAAPVPVNAEPFTIAAGDLALALT